MPKLKTNRAAAKRFSVTKNKKFKYKKAGRSHLLECKNAKWSRGKRGAAYVHPSNESKMHRLMPHA